jgi:hypothetical protein
MAALAGLLPGIRDLRAPLAAGYIWLLGLWIAAESAIPRQDEADGVLGSLYRLAGELSTIGTGVVVSFVAYVVGSLSTSLLAPPSSGSRRLRLASRRLALDPFSPQARDELSALARTTYRELDDLLSMSGTGVEELLDSSRVTAAASDARNPKIFPGSWRRRRQVPMRKTVIRGGPPHDFESELQRRIERGVTRDLDTIATTRLLGRDQELFSAVDRLRAEMEFRRAIVPPLIFVAGAVVVVDGGLWPVVVAIVAVVVSCGLILDAARLERRVNDLLLDVLADERVQSPLLERLRQRAVAITTRTPADDAQQALSRVAAGIRSTIRHLESLASSGPSQSAMARESATAAAVLLDELARSELVGEQALVPATAAVELLSAVADGWVAGVEGEPRDAEADRAKLAEAEEQYARFLGLAKREVALARANVRA